ncbi:MAG: hypothetical protein JW713_00515, partial [Pontiellaceae bacterium]|nr:hypothetical protein [Pontiellaceae bacterium]
NQEIIPFLQCAGHLEYVLTREAYAGFSKKHGGYSYCLADEAVLPFAESLIDEIATQHPGLKHLHVGGDEVGPGDCERCAAGDFRKSYLKHYATIAEYCRKRGIVPLMWTDVIAPFKLQDKPEVVASFAREAAKVLPREVIGVDWRYRGADYYVAPRLREVGLRAFTAPAARCSGDVFALPRLMLHMDNIRLACLQAVEWKLPGTIITSWSYRGSPHEVCLPEYACAAYGWNTGEGEIPALLGRFFRQRYGLPEADGASLAQAALEETKQYIPTAQAKPSYDIDKRAWIMSAAKQSGQLIALAGRKDPAALAASLENQVRLFDKNDVFWQSALQNATRFQGELRCWNLSRRHLKHRLELSRVLMMLKTGANVDKQLASLNEARNRLRDEWRELYRDVYTPPFMQVDLEVRFGAEPGIIDALRRWQRTPAPTGSKSASSAPALDAAGNTLAVSLVRRITFDGFAANEVYPTDIDGDGRMEFLCLQSPGIYQSEVFNDTRFETPAEMRAIYCLTAITSEGKILWQFGKPCLKFPCPNSHVADQMISCRLIANREKQEIAVLNGKALLILDGPSGAVKRSTELVADNYCIVRCIHTRKGNRLLVQNTERGYVPYEYGLPALIYDAANLRLIATIPDAVGSGHSPRVLDINDDGDDELLIGFDAYDANGRRLWRVPGPHRDHVDQLQVGWFGSPATAMIVYAASADVEAVTLNGKLLWKRDFGHPQHVVLGDFRSGDKKSCMAIYCCRLGSAQRAFLEKSGTSVADKGRKTANIAFVDHRGEIVNLLIPPPPTYHSGEGILVYPQGCSDESDVVITRDWAWPQALDLAGESPFAFVRPEPAARTVGERPVGPGPDGYGVRIADCDGDGRAEVLIHDQAELWIYKPPYPKRGTPNSHGKLQPITGQGWYGYKSCTSR